jgi:hypothetical protein
MPCVFSSQRECFFGSGSLGIPMPLKRRSTRVVLILLRSAFLFLVAFLILRWTWSRGIAPVGVGIIALTTGILLDLWQQFYSD